MQNKFFSVYLIMFQVVQNIEFSELLKHNSGLFKLNPKGDAFAVAVHSRLNVWDLESMEICHRFVCLHSIQNLEWSPDSDLILCVNKKKNIIQIWNLHDCAWHCKIEESCLGIVEIQWAPDSRHILVISEFHIRMTVWSLVSKSVTHIQHFKSLKSTISFTSCSKYLILAERKNSKDYLALYTCDTWELLKRFLIGTRDLSEIQISPNGFIICAIESITEGFKVLFYSIDGRQLGNYTTCDTDVGVQLLTCCPTNSCIAISDYNDKVHLLHGTSFDLMLRYEHPEAIESKNVKVYMLIDKHLSTNTANAFLSNFEKYQLVEKRPIYLPCVPLLAEESATKHPLKYGVHTLRFSSDGRYIASINGRMPRVVCIFSMEKCALSDVVVHSHTIKSISWHHNKPLLAISTGTSSVYIWTPNACFLFHPPFEDPFALNKVSWCPGKEAAILSAKDCSSVLRLS